jgi:hypothetical protein
MPKFRWVGHFEKDREEKRTAELTLDVVARRHAQSSIDAVIKDYEIRGFKLTFQNFWRVRRRRGRKRR